MVKGVSRQVIVVQSPDKKIFEQAIFILRADMPEEGVTDEMLLREAKKAVRHPKRQPTVASRIFWAMSGALATAAVWLVTVLA